MKKNILTLLYFCVGFKILAQTIPEFEGPTDRRQIITYPAPLLPIDGEYGIWYKTTQKENNGLNRITRPFIICEGFDVANDIEFIDLYEQLNDNAYILRDNKRNLSNIKTINNLL